MLLWLWIVLAVLVAGLLCVAYGVFVERTWFRLGRYRLDILPAGSGGTMSVLHLSDLHLVRRDRRKLAFLRSLPQADLTVITGDLLGEPEAAEVTARALRPLRGRLASYVVLGSNDYFAPRPLNYLAYFAKRAKRRLGIRGRSGDLLRLLEADGWQHLKNTRSDAMWDGASIEVMGMDDPHIHRHDLRVARRRSPGRFGLAMVHAPDPAPELAALGWDLILSGHTHGGQVRLPLVGALVSNSTIPTRLCMGLSSLGRSFLHVSPGMGTSKYAPFRFLCRPEATLFELRPAPAGGPAEPLH
jgi:predicted MPP superfamily phosphohydrolase